MYKGHKARELKREELAVGMEVAIAGENYYVYRYTRWVRHRIEKLTPKKTKVTLDNGVVLNVGEYSTNIFRYEEWMEEESGLAAMDSDAVRTLYDMKNTDFTSFVASISEEEMPEVYRHIVVLGNRIKEYKEKRKNKSWY